MNSLPNDSKLCYPLDIFLPELGSTGRACRYCLGIESSANKLGIAIVSVQRKHEPASGDTWAETETEILINCRETYNAQPGEGFIPRDIAKHHRERFAAVLKRCLLEFSDKISVQYTSIWECIHLIAYTQGPGIASALSVASTVSRYIGSRKKIPVIGINHCVAHIEMGRKATGIADPISLYVSGGNTQVLKYSPMHKRYVIIGETLDAPIGNVLDRCVRSLKLPNIPQPGKVLEDTAYNYKVHWSKEFNEEWPPILTMPYGVKGMDISFSGVLTRTEKYIKEMGESSESTVKRADIKTTDPLNPLSAGSICYSLQEHTFAMLAEVTERAITAARSSNSYSRTKEGLILVGGVGCNKRLQDILAGVCNLHEVKFGQMDESYCIDNGGMIAHTAWKVLEGMAYQALCNRRNSQSCEKLEIPQSLSLKGITINQRQRTDSVMAHWREAEDPQSNLFI